jgi:hypothetical protein
VILGECQLANTMGRIIQASTGRRRKAAGMHSHAERGNDRTVSSVSFPRSAWECRGDALRPVFAVGTLCVQSFRIVRIVPTLCVGMPWGRSASSLCRGDALRPVFAVGTLCVQSLPWGHSAFSLLPNRRFRTRSARWRNQIPWFPRQTPRDLAESLGYKRCPLQMEIQNQSIVVSWFAGEFAA